MGSSEFAVYPLAVGAGQIALSPIPGRSGSYENDLSTVLRWAPDLVITMTTGAELDRMGATGLPDDLAAIGTPWWHLPIVDFGAPSPEIEAQWASVSAQGAEVLARGGRILVHCFGGCGRSGMIALRLMVEAGEPPEQALRRLRQTRTCAVETDAQKAWSFSASA